MGNVGMLYDDDAQLRSWERVHERLALEDAERDRYLRAVIAKEDKKLAKRRAKLQYAAYHRESINEQDNRYGMLTVEGPGGRTSAGGTAWLCRCDCGRTRIVLGTALRRSSVWHCGQDVHGRRGGSIPIKKK
jgi:hypothetical protein